MPKLRNYHILISHSWDYSDQYESIKGWFDWTPYFAWKDYSVPLTKPLDVNGKMELQRKLRDHIAPCHCIIVLSGMYAAYSEWIEYEIDTAVELGKSIIGVRPRGQERVPRVVQDNATVMVGWSHDSIIDAVRRYAL